MKRNLFIAALALLTTMGAGVAQAQYRDCDRVAADIIGIRLGNNLSITARLNDRRAYDDDRFWCSEIHRRYGVQEVVLLERRRSGLSWLDILDELLWASSHRYDRYDRRTVIYYPQYTTRYINVRDQIGRDWDNRRWNDRDRDDRWRHDHWNDRDHDNRWHDRDRDRNEHHAWNDRDRNDRDHNGRDGNDRDRNDRDRNDRNRNDRNDRNNDRTNDRNRNTQGRNDRNDNTNRNHSRDRNIGNIRG